MNSNNLLRDVKILAVDDDRDTREMLRFILEGQGADVAVAQSVPEAVDTFHNFVPHVILTDIGMADYNGYALMAQVRADDEKSGRTTPAIALTAYTSPADEETALSAGFLKYLSKPFEPAELIEAIRSVVPDVR